jgi:hypothetical protein
MNSTSTSTSPTSPDSTWSAWRQLSDDLVIRLAIDAASRRIAAGYAR